LLGYSKVCQYKKGRCHYLDSPAGSILLKWAR
jgi:hypothetical protein